MSFGMGGELGMEQEKRVARAVAEGPAMEWAKSPLGWVVSTRSGGCYQVTETSCTCPDFQKHCAGTEMRCKHVVALLMKLAAEAPAFEPAPARESRKEREAREDAIFWKVFGK